MKKKYLNFVSVGVISLFSMACTHESIDDLVEPTNPEETDLITYTEHVRSIIQNNCVMCHANPPVNGAPMSLTTYSDVKNAVQNRGLLDRIQRLEGEPGAMPLGGPRLPQSLIDVIVKWNTDGLKE